MEKNEKLRALNDVSKSLLTYISRVVNGAAIAVVNNTSTIYFDTMSFSDDNPSIIYLREKAFKVRQELSKQTQKIISAAVSRCPCTATFVDKKDIRAPEYTLHFLAVPIIFDKNASRLGTVLMIFLDSFSLTVPSIISEYMALMKVTAHIISLFVHRRQVMKCFKKRAVVPYKK